MTKKGKITFREISVMLLEWFDRETIIESNEIHIKELKDSYPFPMNLISSKPSDFINDKVQFIPQSKLALYFILIAVFEAGFNLSERNKLYQLTEKSSQVIYHSCFNLNKKVFFIYKDEIVEAKIIGFKNDMILTDKKKYITVFNKRIKLPFNVKINNGSILSIEK